MKRPLLQMGNAMLHHVLRHAGTILESDGRCVEIFVAFA